MIYGNALMSQPFLSLTLGRAALLRRVIFGSLSGYSFIGTALAMCLGTHPKGGAVFDGRFRWRDADRCDREGRAPGSSCSAVSAALSLRSSPS
jgi:hypothetical protein